MSQNGKLLNLTTKATTEQCKYILKTAKNNILFIINAQVHDGNRDHDVDVYLNNLCKNNKQFQVKYTYKFKLYIPQA